MMAALKLFSHLGDLLDRGTGSGPPPTYTPAWKFNDVGPSGDRNSMYLPFI
jgi:hypothetical protein